MVGIAAGVALLFAALVSNSSLQSSVSQLARGVAGHAQLQLLARDPHGFPQSVLVRVRHIAGVRVAAPILEASANAIGPKGSESVQLIGADSNLHQLGGTLTRDAALSPFGGIGAVVLPATLARTIGVQRFGADVTLQLEGRTTRAPLYEQLSASQIGPLVSSPVALAPLSYVQEMTGLGGRLTRILLESAPGAEGRVHTALEMIAHGRLNVEPIDYEQGLFAEAAQASNQSTALFAAVSAIVGFLFAFNAMLLTVPQRRRLIADLRRDGYAPRTVMAVLLSDALTLGLVACALGLMLGEVLSIYALHSNPAFLSLAFALGSGRVVSWQDITIACAGGMLAAVLAVLLPLRDVFYGKPSAALGQRTVSDLARTRRIPALAGIVCIVGGTVILQLAPAAAIPAMVLLVAALVLVLPLALNTTLALAGWLAGVAVSAVPHIAVAELRASGPRSGAIAATGAIAVFGSVTIAGAHHDLLRGLERSASETSASSQVWISPAGAYDLLDTSPFPSLAPSVLKRVPGVREVLRYRGGLLDYGRRRALVVAPAPGAMPLLPAGQIVRGTPRQATRRVRSGGWLILSGALAREHHLHLGEVLELPSPNPTFFRLAALSTNLGWAPGAIIMNGSDYARAWGSQDASAYGINLASHTSAPELVARIAKALGPYSGLSVQTREQRVTRQDGLSRQALSRLSAIATLIPIVAVLAMAAAIGAMIWQRRPRLAKLRLEGLARRTLLSTILLEGALLVGAGSLTGAVFGVYGQRLSDNVLAGAINFPVQHTLTVAPAMVSLALVIVPTLAVLAIPGYLATRVAPALALME